MINILNGIIKALGNSVTSILSILPMSPFRFEDTFDSALLGWINLILPVGRILSLFVSYLFAVGVYYAYRIILRWLKVAGS